MATKGAAAVHHVSKNIGIDVVNAATEAAETSTTGETTAAIHVSWVPQIVSVIESSTFPNEVSIVSNGVESCGGLTEDQSNSHRLHQFP